MCMCMCFIYAFCFLFYIGVVTYVDKNTKSCTVSFDTADLIPVGNVPFTKIDYYLQQSEFFSTIGPVRNIIAKFLAGKSLFTIDAHACLTIKYADTPVVPAYEFDSTVFNFVEVSVGDCLLLDKITFREACSHLEMEIVAKDDANYYVSVCLCLLFVFYLAFICLLCLYR